MEDKSVFVLGFLLLDKYLYVTSICLDSARLVLFGLK